MMSPSDPGRFHRLRLKAKWQTHWLWRKYRIRFGWEPTGRIVNGCYTVVRRLG